jgi:hypothetical protein
MNKRLKELAAQAGATVHKAMHGEAISFLENDLERFAELVRQDEREACAAVVEGRLSEGLNFEGCADAIRARGKPSPAFKNYIDDNWAGIV